VYEFTETRMKQLLLESTEFRNLLIAWFLGHGRKLPWRQTTNPYCILVSELMLQQTQVSTVVGYYRRWIERFPTVEALASASEPEVLRAWQGLGYYARARNLHRCAKVLVQNTGGEFPTSVDQLMQLPGVGRYTAGAIASFAFDQCVGIVDSNVARVLSRLIDLRQAVDSSAGERTVWKWAEKLVQCDQPRLFNSALMELGAMVCRPRKPGCTICPVRRYCGATDPGSLPRKRPRPKIEERQEDYFWIFQQDRILLQQRSGQRWRGLWTLPPAEMKAVAGPPLAAVDHPVTRFLIKLRVFRGELPVSLGEGMRWHPIAHLDELPMPSPHRRAVQRVLESENCCRAPGSGAA
jgi:A/G-specific adenine glycosylase